MITYTWNISQLNCVPNAPEGADYVVTASLSVLDAFHYFNVPNPELWAVGAILAIGLVLEVGRVAALVHVPADFTLPFSHR